VRLDGLQKKLPKLATRIQKICLIFKSPKDLYQSSFEHSKDLHQGPSKSRKYLHKSSYFKSLIRLNNKKILKVKILQKSLVILP
jgi:hypothetical protein